MRLINYVLTRLLYAIPVLLGVTLLVFLISHAIPGDPARMMAGQRRRGSRRKYPPVAGSGPAAPSSFSATWSAWPRDLDIHPEPAPGPGRRRDFFPATLDSAGEHGILRRDGPAARILSAIRRNRPIDHIARVFSVVGVSMPVFWLGLMLLLLFYRTLGWLPGSGRLDMALNPPAYVTGIYLIDALVEGDWTTFINAAGHILLPAFCLSYVYLAIITGSRGPR
jgi:peptide/nickel transport system permease protein